MTIARRPPWAGAAGVGVTGAPRPAARVRRGQAELTCRGQAEPTCRGQAEPTCRGQAEPTCRGPTRRSAADRQRPRSGRHSEARRCRPGDQRSTAFMSSACATNSPPSSASRA